MLKFKVMAGNMYCGFLLVIPGISHNYINRDCRATYGLNAVDKVASYKHLKLIRI